VDSTFVEQEWPQGEGMTIGPSRTLDRTLTVTDLILLTTGTVIGSGVWVVPGAVVRATSGDAGWALLAWLIGGLLSLMGALTYAELGAMKPEAGGLYVYIRDAFGGLAAFLYGWTMFFVLGSGSLAVLAVAFTTYLNELLPLASSVGKAVPVVMIGCLALLNVRGTRQSASVTNWTTGVKVAALVVMSVVLLALAGGGAGVATAADFRPSPITASMLVGVGIALISVLWACEGWQYTTFVGGEAADPQRTLSRGLTLGTGLVVTIYLLANTAYIAALGPARVARSTSVAAEAVGTLVTPAAGRLIALAILVSIFSAANGLVLSAPRVFFAMARDGVFFQRLAEVHPRFRTPAFAIVAGAGWAAVLAASGTFEQLLTYVVFVGWMFYGLGGLSLFYYRRAQPRATRPFRVPGYPLTPTLFVLSAAAIVVNTLATQRTQSLIGLAVVAAGLPAYFIWRTLARARN